MTISRRRTFAARAAIGSAVRLTRGFTLVEILMVLVIVGLLAMVGLPRYTKTVETTRAEVALTAVRLIATANRQWAIDRAAYVEGSLNQCASATCSAPFTNACVLLACGYMAKDAKFLDAAGATRVDAYDYQACNGADKCGLGATGANYAACVKRRAGSCEGCTEASPFNTWGYTVTKDGVAEGWPTGANAPPKPSR